MSSRLRVKTAAVLAFLVAVLLGVWLFRGSAIEPAPPGVPRDAAATREEPAPGPLLAGTGDKLEARAARPAEPLRVRVISDCGGVPLSGAVCGWGERKPLPEYAQIRTILAGPSEADGILTLDSSAVQSESSETGSSDALLVSAPGHETRILDGVPAPGVRGAAIEVQLQRMTRVAGEIAWPEGWLERVRETTVAAGLAPLAKGASWTARGLQLAEDRRSFQGTIRGCGRFWVICNYMFDDDESGSLLATVEIDASTEADVHVSLHAPPDARQPSTERMVRWTVVVTDEEGHPIENATIRATRRLATSSRVLRNPWQTDARGEAVREVPIGRYYFNVSKPGWGTSFAWTSMDRDHRDVVRLARSRTKLIVRLARVGTDASEPIIVELRQADPERVWPWLALDSRTMAGSSATTVEFDVVEGPEYAVYASGRGAAPAAQRVPKIAAEERERLVDLALGTGDRVEVRGLEQQPTTEPRVVMIEYEGLLGEILTATPQATYADGKWTLDHVASTAGVATADVGGRRLRGRLPAAREAPRIIELR